MQSNPYLTNYTIIINIVSNGELQYNKYADQNLPWYNCVKGVAIERSSRENILVALMDEIKSIDGTRGKS